MAEGWKRFKILILIVPAFVIVISLSLFSSRVDRRFAETASGVNIISMSQNEKGEFIMASDNNRLLNDVAVVPKQSVSLSNMKLPKYNESFRNPCWYDEYNKKVTFRCFPYFHIAGFPKSATTDLFSKISAHPLVIGATQKAPHYFTKTFYKTTLRPCASHYHCPSVKYSSTYFTQGAGMILMTSDTKLLRSTFLQAERSDALSHTQIDFINRFPRESLDIWKQAQKFYKYPGIAVDGSASSAWHLMNFRGIVENLDYVFPRNTSADWIRHIYPGAKIIMSLREPVARAFSHYKMHAGRHSTGQGFHNQVRKDLHRFETCLKSRKAVLLCSAYMYHVRIQAGLYYHHLKLWFEKLPRKQFLILRYEDYSANMTATLAKIFEFLELPAISQEGLEFITTFKFQHKFAFPSPKMLPKTKALLTNFYKPFNEKLAKLMGDERFLWHGY